MRTRVRTALLGAAALTGALVVPLSAPAYAGRASCDPVQTQPRFRGQVPTAREVLGFDLGDREVTSAESDRYLQAVAASSRRVVDGTLATSVQGRPLRYAVVGKARNVSRAGLQRVRADAARLRDPQTSARQAERITHRSPTILWVAGNVHGNEESGADAALRTLYELADRRDCAARRILDNAVVVVLPIQNPDGREADTRRNAYGFDMNRDWFARTQPETDGKLSLLNQLPPVLFIDAHEMGGTSFFFPPNADPIYHEITDESVDWINNLYGSAMGAEFDRQGIDYFNRDVYDLFYMGYGDTVPSTGFIAAGMTYEKGGDSPISDRTYEQYLTQWVSLSQATEHRQSILDRWHAAYVEAYDQGRAGKLEPNEVVNPGNDVQTQVPDRKVREYFLRSGNPAKRAEVRTVVRRLQRMGVDVRRLTAPLRVPDYRAYGRAPKARTLPRGTFAVSLAQGQKHWVQAMLNENTYTPFPYFYDVTAWSLPLLGNVRGGYSGARLHQRSRVVASIAQPRGPRLPRRLPTIGVLQTSQTSSSSVESTGWLRYKLDKVWHLPYRLLGPGDVSAGRLAGTDVLLVPNGPADSAYDALGADGRNALQQWVHGGGRWVGWSGGTALAARLGLTGATLTEPTSDVPGTLFRVDVDRRSPLARHVGRHAWQFYAYDNVMHAADPADVVVSYPDPQSRDWFVSGFERGASELGRTAAVVDERAEAGRVVSFASEPNFRAFTDGTAKMVLNAVVGHDPTVRAAGTSVRPAEAAIARRHATTLSAGERPVRVAVRPADAGATADVLRSLGVNWSVQRSAGRVAFVVANPRGVAADELGWVRALPQRLRAQRVTPIAVAVP